MGSLGFSEMLMIFVIALLVFGPKKLPELGKSLGKGIREFKKATDELKSSWEDQVKDITEPLNDMKRDFHSVGQSLKTEVYNRLENSVKPAASTEHAAPLAIAATATTTGTETMTGTETHGAEALTHEAVTHEAVTAVAHDAVTTTHSPESTESTTPKEHV